MNMCNPVIALLRYRRWWQFIAPLPVAVAVIAAVVSIPVSTRLPWEIVAFLLSTLAIGSYGFLLNDLCDREADRVAGKRNVAEMLGGWLAGGWCLVLLVAGMAPWWSVISAPALAKGLVTVQVVLLTIYSVPPIRLKNRGALGAVADSLYGHTLPPLIAWTAFFRAPPSPFLQVCIAIVMVTLFVKGMRNILTHQLEDRHHDRKAHLLTLVSGYAGERTLEALWRFVIPLEIGLLVVLSLCILTIQPGLIVALLTFLALSEWRIRTMLSGSRGARAWFCERYFLNLFYETWLPLYLFGAAVLQEFSLLTCGVVYLLLFPRTFSEAILPFDALRYTQRAWR